MWPEEMEAILRCAFGDTWRTDFALWGGYSREVVTRYLHGHQPIPKHVANMLHLLRYHDRRRGSRKRIEVKPDWLPPKKE